MFTIGVFAIILNEKNEVLLCHRRDRDLWNLPGGGLENDEAPWEGVVREVKEETGLLVTVDRLIGAYSKPKQNEIVFSFLCSVKGGKIEQTDEADKIGFFDVDRLPNNLSLNHRERIQDSYSPTTDVIFKIQGGPSVSGAPS